MKKRSAAILKLLVSFGLLLLLFRLIDPQAALAALAQMDYRYFAVAVLLSQVTQVIRSFRWRALLQADGVQVPIWRLIYLYYVGTFFNTFLPSGFGGDAVKMYELNAYSQRTSEAVGTVLVDRLMGLIALLVLGLLACPFATTVLPAAEVIALGAMCALGLLAGWLLFQKRVIESLLRVFRGKIGASLARLYDAIHTCGTRALWQALVLSLGFNIIVYAMVFTIAMGLGVRLPVFSIAVFMPIISLSMLIPSLGALGTRESAYVLTFAGTGLTTAPMAMAISLVLYMVNLVTGAVGAVLYAIQSIREMRGRHPSDRRKRQRSLFGVTVAAGQAEYRSQSDQDGQ